MRKFLNPMERFNKTVLIIAPTLLLTVVVLFGSCYKKYEGLSLSLAVNNTTLDLDTAAGSTHIMVYATGKWNLAFKTATSWATLNKTEGEGNSDFVLSYQANYDTARSATIVISRDTLVREIVINQKGH
ncbi:hypothetical protein A8C56_12145 [Niabella ginsenosidivorans]|uniref:BACON domain-containing protein n=1 Tax=Niabella ginsenosidivorans TaxID=1176587 RepID=A0A1A9I4J7_9BACT|nr:BACON domain-containing protein [Niabella ginsenosidivorans]ANH81630.1 hypothetical protein A8C56_12145 [Niabella ginsenosidivorans]